MSLCMLIQPWGAEVRRGRAVYKMNGARSSSRLHHALGEIQGVLEF